MPSNPLDVEAQGAQLDTRDSSGNQWLLSSLYFLSRLLELVSIQLLNTFDVYRPIIS